MAEIGDRVTVEGQRFDCIAVLPDHVDVKGIPFPASVWQAVCANQGCNAVFQTVWPLNFPQRHERMRRRCDVHRAPGVRVNPGSRSFSSATHATALAQKYLISALEWGPMTVAEMIRNASFDYDDLNPKVAAKLGVNASDKYKRHYMYRLILPLIEKNIVKKEDGVFKLTDLDPAE